MRFLNFLIAFPLNFIFGLGMVYLRDIKGAILLFLFACLASASTWSIYFLLDSTNQTKNTNLIWYVVFLILLFISVSVFITWRSSKNKKSRKKLGLKKNIVFVSCSILAYLSNTYISPRGLDYLQAYNVPAGSMAPTLLDGDYFWATKIKDIQKLHSGDVVVFLTSQNEKVAFVKRLIGLPGDRVQVKAGILYINDVEVERTFMETATAANGSSMINFKVYEETLPNGSTQLIQERSDNDSYDNTFVYQVPEGHYFMMGDNRDNSRDSRTSSVGMVPAENILGKARIIFFSGKGFASIDGYRFERIGLAID